MINYEKYEEEAETYMKRVSKVARKQKMPKEVEDRHKGRKLNHRTKKQTAED